MVPAFLMVEVLKGRESLGAQVFVYDQWGIRIASGIDKAYMVVPSGKLWVYASTTDNDSSFDHKKIKTSATASLRPLQKQKLRLDVTPATLDVRLFNNGRNAQGVISLLTQGGKSVLDWDAGEKVTVPPGDIKLPPSWLRGTIFKVAPQADSAEAGAPPKPQSEIRNGCNTPVRASGRKTGDSARPSLQKR